MFQIREVDQGSQFESVLSSWDLGWRSLLFEHLRYRRPSDELVKPPMDEQSIVLVTRGQCEFESRSGSQWRWARYHVGQIRVTAPMRPTHLRWRVASTDPFEVVRLSVRSEVISRLVEETWDRDAGSATLPDSVDTTDPVVRQTMLGILRAARDGVGDFYAESARTFLLTHLLARNAGLTIPKDGREDARVDRARSFLHASFNLPLTLDQVASEAGLSPYHFLRVFQAQTGETPIRYLMRVRVEQGQDELVRSADTVAAIAARCGFASATHFATAFRRHTGLSPSAWRSLHGHFGW